MNSKVVSEQYTYIAIFNMMWKVSTQKSLSTAEYTLFSAVDKDLGLLLCSSMVKVC